MAADLLFMTAKIVLLIGTKADSRHFFAMARFYFHRHLNGQAIIDQKGVAFDDVGAACSYAVRRMPGALIRALGQRRPDVHAATEVSNGTRTLYIIRGKIMVERK